MLAFSCSSALHIRPLRQRSSAPKNDSDAPALRRTRSTIALALRRVSAPIKSAISAAAALPCAISLLTVGALTITPPEDAVEKASMAPFAWHLFWRRVTRPEAAQAEARLLDLGLGAGRWRRSDTAASSAPDDYVHSVTIDGTGDTVRSPTLVMVHGLANGGGIFTRNLRAALGGVWQNTRRRLARRGALGPADVRAGRPRLRPRLFGRWPRKVARGQGRRRPHGLTRT